MATLEKIRSKSVILFIIIIVALLAFILGDFLTSSRSLTGPGTTAAKVAGEKIDFQQFQNNVEQQREAMQNQGYTDIDISQVQQQVLEQMVLKALLDKEIQDLGIKVTKEELTSAMVGENPLPGVVQFARQYGFNSPQEFYNAVFTSGQIPPQYQQQFQQLWLNLESQVKEMLLQQKLGTLVSGALATNKLDARSYYDDNARTARVAYTRKDYSMVTDEEAPITSDDLRAVYNERKNRYKLMEETRPVDYIVVDIVPSSDDRLAAEKEVENALVALREKPGTEGVSDNLNFVVNRSAAPRSMLTPNALNNLDSLQADNVRILQFRNNVYTIGKLVDVYNDIDSVYYEYAVISAPVENRDSVIGLLNAGVPVDTLRASGFVAETADNQVASLPQAAQLSEPLKTLPLNVYVIPEGFSNDQQAMALRVTKRNKPVPFYDVAEITYRIDPSSTTVSKLRADLKAYADSNNNQAAFSSNADKGGYAVASTHVTPSSLSIANIKDTRSPAKWAMNAKKGQVSNVYGDEQTGKFIVVAVKDIYDGGYVPANDNDVSREISARARLKKRGEKLVSDYTGKANTLEGYAELMGSPVDTTEVTFGQNFVKGFPIGQSPVLANAAVSEVGKLIGPFPTDNGVVVLEVIDIETSPREYDYDNDAMMFNQQQGAMMLQRNLNDVLLGRNKITNNLQKFYAE